MDNKLSFNKRIFLTKKEVFDGVTLTGELDKIKGSKDSGFYSIATIENFLYPALDKYNIDLDLEILADRIVGHWYDCESDKIRHIEVDFHRIENVGKLQLMAHEVQSEGAVKSYTRRYALTAILRLPSTDLIDKSNREQQNRDKELKEIIRNKDGVIVDFLENKCGKKYFLLSGEELENFLNNIEKLEQQKKEKEAKKQAKEVWKPNTKQYHTLKSMAEKKDGEVKFLIKNEFNVDSSTKLNKDQFNQMIKYFNLVIMAKNSGITEEQLKGYTKRKFGTDILISLTDDQIRKITNDMEKQLKQLEKQVETCSLPLPDKNKDIAQPVK